jgi:hypothetical protein
MHDRVVYVFLKSRLVFLNSDCTVDARKMFFLENVSDDFQAVMSILLDIDIFCSELSIFDATKVLQTCARIRPSIGRFQGLIRTLFESNRYQQSVTTGYQMVYE